MADHIVFSADKVAVITGAAEGIGRACAARFASRGMHVLMADRRAEKLNEAAIEVRAAAASSAVRINTCVGDVSRLADVEALKALAYQEFGQVDVLMNNAGTSVPTSSWGELDNWRHLIDVNMWGILHGIQTFTQSMIDQGSPAIIVNTGSKQGITNPPGNPAYNASKAAVKAATESLQHDLRNTDNCQVNAHLLVPGYTYTGLTRQRVSEKPAGAWLPEQVTDYMIEHISRGSFYVICPDNEVTSEEDARRVLWGAGDIAHNRPPLSRWQGDYNAAFAQFKPTS